MLWKVFKKYKFISPAKNLLYGFFLSLIIIGSLYILIHIMGYGYIYLASQKQVINFNRGIDQDVAHLKKQGDELAQSSVLIKELLSKNRNELIRITKQEREKRNIGLMGVANATGVIMSRTLSSERYGDNVFLTAPVGRIVARGVSSESIEMSGFYDQLFMTTGRPIWNQGTMIGALFANYLLNDQYAIDFKNRFLSKGTHVVFYTKQAGVYGSSFTDQDINKTITSYFSTGSEWIDAGMTNKTIYLENGTAFYVKNIVFPGLEQSPGGALLFIPRPDVTNVASIILAVIAGLVFIYFMVRYHKSCNHKGRHYFFWLGVCVVPLVAIFYSVFYIDNLGYPKIGYVPYKLYNSTLELEPSSGIYAIHSEQVFDIVIKTGDEVINAAQIELAFDPKKVEINELDTDNSACSHILEKTIDSINGKIILSCVIIDSKVSREKTVSLGKIIATPIAVGTFDFVFDLEGTKVLADDGLGTDVLRIAQNASYRIDNFNLDQSKQSGVNFILFSPTHPNESRWYNKKTAKFVWLRPKDSSYRYVVDTYPNTIPDKGTVVHDNQVSFPIQQDGVLYFHLQSIKGGPVVHYKLQSDFTPPDIISINKSETEIHAGSVVRFSFNAEDVLSGVQRNYYIDLIGHLFLPVGNQVFVPFSEIGKQTITLRVYDLAGNYTDQSEIITVVK